jgi:Melibiase/Alpha galactosidase C-terminal beta sandwich domain
MPVMVIGRVTKDRWLVEGAATQDRHAPSWHLNLPAAPGRIMEYRSEYWWNGGSQEEIAPGETLALESTLYLLVETTPDRFYEAYTDELVELYGDRFAGPNSRLALEPVYCTWNYGIYTGVNEKDCLKRIAIAGKAQKGGIFQLDHGYQPPHKPHLSWGHLDAYYPDTTLTWDKERFPGGPKRIVEECHKHGLTPAIWWTPRMDVGGPISQDHPEWIAINRSGSPIENVGDLHPDYSVPQVREFIQKTLRTVIHDWGFEGIKLDFFSWAFDAPDLVYRNGGTSVSWKRWLLKFVREELGKTGYFLHCVSCPLGNPFLAIDGCDSFRAGGDIDHGGWENNVYNCSWILASFPSNGNRTWFADMDSFMGDRKYPGNERRFRGAMGYMTSGMIDISGPIETFDRDMMNEYRLLSERCDQGGPVRVLDRTAFFGRPLPRVLARLHDRGSKTRKKFGAVATVGLFNWDNTAQTVGFGLSQLGLKAGKVKARDFWTGKSVALDGELLATTLQPRQHLFVDLLAK